jgi:hypothetical protein
MSLCCPIPAELVLRKAWSTADEFGSIDFKALKKALIQEGYEASDKRLIKRIDDLREAKVKLPTLPAPRRMVARITCTTAKVLQEIGREEYARWKRSQSEDECEHRFEG